MAVETVNLLLGPGELFLKRATDGANKYMRVGNLKGTVTFNYDLNTVEQQPGNRLTAVRRDKTSERVTLKATVADFKVAQVIYALGQTVSTTQITLTHTLRCWEEVKFGLSTVVVTLANSAVSMTSVIVTSIDQATKYARGATGYTMTSVNKLKPKGSLINKAAMVAYDSADTAATAIRCGDKLNLQIVSLKFSHRLSNGKFITIEIPKATISGGLTIPFSSNEYTAYDVTFSALGDTTAVPGRSLFNIIREA
jgi:hypothetical protein